MNEGSSNEIITRLTHRLFGAPLLRNSIRGELVEEMVAVAVEPKRCARGIRGLAA